MSYPSIRIEGSIFSPDIIDRLDDAAGQRSIDFGLDPTIKVKDEIARAWADAQDYWRIFQRRLETIKDDSAATTETRNLWIVPLLGLLGYQAERQSKGIEVNDKSYPISHRVTNRAGTPLHIVGYAEPGGLDKKPQRAALRMSPHAMLQEYLNLSEELYGIVTNGHVLRLLRDSSRLIKLTYLEFDLDRIFSDGLFADFAILFRLLHATRLPKRQDAVAESLIERYHQDSLESGARIREGLSRAVEEAIKGFANGFLSHSDNDQLREEIRTNRLSPAGYYQQMLRLIYRLLFLMVTEERGLIVPTEASAAQRQIYNDYYSVQRLRRLSERRYLADKRKQDLWSSLGATFRLFEADGPGPALGLKPLAGDLFGPFAIRNIANCSLGNDVLLQCVRALSTYENPITKQPIRVNYAALGFEEFGSVYEGLLEYKPVFTEVGTRIEFSLAQGSDRAVTGSHYTPEDLVQPLIKHSLDYLIADCLKKPNPAAALLDLRVADIACGSGHILLSAARRIATELAILQSGEDQPSPSAFRSAIREVIRNCIYGVDLNPLAVDLCKVALWLEAHNPGEPLNFLDHHIKCGNAIVGFVRPEDVDRGVPDEAFKTLPGDDTDVASECRKLNKKQRGDHASGQLQLGAAVEKHLEGIRAKWASLSALPERTPAEVEAKKAQFEAFSTSPAARQLIQVAAIPIAQFYIPKTLENKSRLLTDERFRRYWNEGQVAQGEATAQAWALADTKKFFHWFLEFPEIVQRGGFDCILGNPPYMGGTNLSGAYGHPFCNYVKWEYEPTGLSDLVVFFVRRIFRLLRPGGFTGFITTNSIRDGDIRKDGLEQVLEAGGSINMAVRGIKWPGRANLVVSLVAIHQGSWCGARMLDGKVVPIITAYFEGHEDAGSPFPLAENASMVYEGSKLHSEGFLLSNEAAAALLRSAQRNHEVISPTLNGDELNNEPDQASQRSAINFYDWSEDQARRFAEPFRIIEHLVKPGRQAQNDKGARDYWWRYLRPRIEMYSRIKQLRHCYVAAATTKYLSFSSLPTTYVFTHALKVFTTDRWDLYAVVQSTVHEVWARKYSGALETRLRYSPSDCFETFPFPQDQWQSANLALAELGERYHEHRRALMLRLWLGLTDIYNLFHSRTLEADLRKLYATRAKKDPAGIKIPKEHRPAALAFTYEQALAGIIELRRLHVELDTAVRDAYGWDVSLDHDFYDVETLPENDRTRYTISPAARKELLRLLLDENHRRAAAESLPGKGKVKPKSKPAKEAGPLFDDGVS